LLEIELERAYRKAGGRVERQPSTSMLLGEVFDKGELRSLFPGQISLEESKVRTGLAVKLLDAMNMPPSDGREEMIRRVKAKFPDGTVSGVVRFDLSLMGSEPEDVPRSVWLDHAIVHETSASYRDGVLVS
jgi:hypothetical protein